LIMARMAVGLHFLGSFLFLSAFPFPLQKPHSEPSD
jgi:hypothetical protein